MQKPKLAQYKDCTACMACHNVCPKSAITLSLHRDGHYYVDIDEYKCIGCLLCEKSCPIVSPINYSSSETSVFYAAWNKNIEERKRSASGGVFSALASYVIENGGVVFGASNEGVCDIRHIGVDNKTDLTKLQGSKYTQSYIGKSFEMAYGYLKRGITVLFSGTGCQIAGLYSYLQRRKYEGRLITVDLICGGVSSKHLINKFIENEPYKISKVLTFRTKEEGWKSRGFKYNMKVKDENGIIHNYKKIRNLITDGFCLELTNRYSCYNCKFVGTYRKSDLTIGDLWGDSLFPEEHYNGVSLVIAHNKSIIDFLFNISQYLSIVNINEKSALKNNPRIYNGKSYLRFSIERRLMPFFFNNLSYSILKKIYAYDFPNYSPWMIYKICRYTLNKIFFK